MIRITLLRKNVIVAVGIAHRADHAGAAIDAILSEGYEVRLLEFDPETNPISQIDRDNFIRIVAEVNAKILWGKSDDGANA